jgi:molybdate transport system regulatory protein
VTAKTGGRRGGGAVLTPLGEELVARYRAIEENAKRAAATDLRALERSLPRG